MLCGANGRPRGQGGPALSEIAENKIMGEMNGGCKAAGDRGGGGSCDKEDNLQTE